MGRTPGGPTPVLRHRANEDLWTAARVSAAALLRGVPLHLHAEGPRGTGKTTLLRSVAAALPRLRRIRGCPYNCDPGAPHCPLHRELDGDAIRGLGDEAIPVPFVELSASAKVATAVGSVDLRRLVDPAHPEAALLPGGIARAHRGILFVDEINRLADVAPELTDCLLDVMGTKPGRLQIEEAGLPTVELSVAVSVWAASNPDEEPGPLERTRTQLADRFDLRVAVGPPEDVDTVLALLGGGPGTTDAWDWGEAASWADRPTPRWTPDLLRALAETFLRVRLGSLRALVAWQRTAEILAVLDGAATVQPGHVAAAAQLTWQGHGGVPAARFGSAGGGPTAEVTPTPPAPGMSPGTRRPLAPAPDPGAPRTGAAAVPLGEAAADGLAGDGSALSPGPPPRRARRLREVEPLVAPEWTGGGGPPVADGG